MKKSEIYWQAMLSVIIDEGVDPEAKLDIIEQLAKDKSTAEWRESFEGEKNETV